MAAVDLADRRIDAGQVDLERRAVAQLGISPDVAAALVDDPVDRRQTESRPLPRSFVVKNGSKRCESVSALMPQPLSVTAIIT